MTCTYKVEFSLKEGTFAEFKKNMCEKLDIIAHSLETVEKMNGNQFLDYLTDLEWIKETKIEIMIHCANCSGKIEERILSYLFDMIQFWKNDAENCIVGGVTKDVEFCFVP